MATLPVVRNIFADPLTEETTPRGEQWRYLDLSGEHLGARIEALAPGETSSVHHYHTLEEEHVVMLTGSATLVLGSDEHLLSAGDHICFKAGVQDAHHLHNRTEEECRLLVFGERLPGDVVFYPENQVMLVKTPTTQGYTYRPLGDT